MAKVNLLEQTIVEFKLFDVINKLIGPRKIKSSAGEHKKTQDIQKARRTGDELGSAMGFTSGQSIELDNPKIPTLLRNMLYRGMDTKGSLLQKDDRAKLEQAGILRSTKIAKVAPKEDVRTISQIKADAAAKKGKKAKAVGTTYDYTGLKKDKETGLDVYDEAINKLVSSFLDETYGNALKQFEMFALPDVPDYNYDYSYNEEPTEAELKALEKGTKKSTKKKSASKKVNETSLEEVSPWASKQDWGHFFSEPGREETFKNASPEVKVQMLVDYEKLKTNKRKAVSDALKTIRRGEAPGLVGILRNVLADNEGKANYSDNAFTQRIPKAVPSINRALSKI